MHSNTPEAQRAGSPKRVLVLVAGERERELTLQFLARHAVEGSACSHLDDFFLSLEEGAGAALIAEELLTPSAVQRLTAFLTQQPAWSDFPIVIFSAIHRRARPPAQQLARSGNVTFLDRPVQVRTMLAAIHSALASRQRQYQARAAIDARDAFLAMLGHELRNPLSAILMATSALETQLPVVTEKRAYTILNRQSHHLARLVDDLLDVARVTHGKVVLARERLELGDVVRASFEALEAAARQRDQAFALRLDGDSVWVDGDRHRLEQVFTNLLTNALKYTPDGGEVRVVVERRGASAVVSVKDTGIGLAPEMIDRVFDAFAQVEVAEHAKGGLGLGLAVVRSIVQMHGGTVEASSEGLGLGSTFSVSLPCTGAPVMSVAPTETSSTVPPRRAVIVEDNADLRELFITQLQQAGHDVTSAEDGPEGVDKILAIAPDIAFVDLGLPGISGIEVAERLRAAGATTYLVAVTGYGQPQDRARALRAGFDDHLVKPAKSEDLLRALAAATRR